MYASFFILVITLPLIQINILMFYFVRDLQPFQYFMIFITPNIQELRREKSKVMFAQEKIQVYFLFLS